MAVPAAIPVTVPDEFTVAILVALLLQEPPEAVEESETEVPAHIAEVPEIVPAIGAA